jgi:hypothetical protein
MSLRACGVEAATGVATVGERHASFFVTRRYVHIIYLAVHLFLIVLVIFVVAAVGILQEHGPLHAVRKEHGEHRLKAPHADAPTRHRPQ